MRRGQYFEVWILVFSSAQWPLNEVKKLFYYPIKIELWFSNPESYNKTKNFRFNKDYNFFKFLRLKLLYGTAYDIPQKKKKKYLGKNQYIGPFSPLTRGKSKITHFFFT